MKQFYFLLACLILEVNTVECVRSRVIGGGDVPTPGKWPWQGSLRVNLDTHNCGCILISNLWVLTAAHCVPNSARVYKVELGLHDRTTREEGAPETYTLLSIARHPDYESVGYKGYPNDVAVLRLGTPAEINQFVRPASLAGSFSGDFVGAECYITGWGRRSWFGSLANILQEARVDVYTTAECGQVWGDMIQNLHICVGDRISQAKGACNGDSGGPLACRVGSSYQVAGVGSWGRTGCATTYPTVYARVSYYRNWIMQQTGV